MYKITEKEYRDLEKIIYREMKSFTRIFKYDVDEFYNMGIYAVGKACATYKEDAPASFRTYASKCIKNEFLNFNKKYRRKLSDVSLQYETNDKDEDETTTLLDKMGVGHEAFDLAELNLDLQEALKTLSPRDYKIITLWMEGYKHREIAEEIGVNKCCIGTYLSRIYNKLKKELEVTTC